MKQVSISEYVVNEPDEIESIGFGPCIGVAMIWNETATVMHCNDPRMDTGPKFFAEIAEGIPSAERCKITPVVFGGSLDQDEQTVADETLSARDWVVSALIQLGFKAVEKHWCPDVEGASQDLLVCVKEGQVRITTENPATKSCGSQSFQF
jgi:hypothetical protein